MEKQRKIILFDIDGVLINDQGLGKKCFIESMMHFNQYWQINSDYIFDGKTDYQIVSDLIKMNKSNIAEDYIKKVLEQYYALVKKYITNFDIAALPGTLSLITYLHKKKYTIGVLSGNMAQVGSLKLKHCGFDTNIIEIFSFGDLAPDRNHLYTNAITFLKTKKIISLKRNKILIVGDTPIDIKCAKNSKLKIVAVATGCYSVDQLTKFKPDWILPDLKNIQLFEKIVLSL